jgi:hypothetical protein
MIKFLLPTLLILSQVCFSQTNYNTILAPKIDSTNKLINLRLEKKEKLETVGNLLFATGILSTILLYNIEQKSPILFVTPATICLSGMIAVGLSAKYEDE